MRLRRPAIALLLSVALHAAVMLVLERRSPPPPPPKPPAPATLELDVRYLPPPTPAPSAPSAPAPAPASRPQRVRRTGPRAAPSETAPTPAAPGESTGRSGDAPLASGESVPTSPNGSWVLGMPTLEGPDGHSATAAPGHTRHPGDPVPKESLAEEGERVRQRVQGMADGMLSTLRVADGNFHPYFVELGQAMQERAKRPPPFKAPNLAQGFLEDWSRSMANYGRTGNPYGSGPAPTTRPDEASRNLTLQRERMGLTDPTLAMNAQSKLLQLATSGGKPPAIVAIVDLFQGPDGSLRRIVLTQSSGQKGFDDHVLATAPTALTSLAPPPPAASPKIAREQELHTTWAFEGRLEYRRHLRDMNLKEDGWYLAAALPASLLGGNFEETTGDVQVVDVRQVSYVCTVKLLQIH